MLKPESATINPIIKRLALNVTRLGKRVFNPKDKRVKKIAVATQRVGFCSKFINKTSFSILDNSTL